MSNAADIFAQRLAAVRTWKRSGQQAVHKPLLLLYAISSARPGKPRLIPYVEVDRDLRPLLLRFGPERSTVHPEYPFWRLQNDGLWEVVSDQPMRSRKSNSDPPRSELIEKGARGGFKEEFYAALSKDQNFREKVSIDVLRANFPEDVHESIRSAIRAG